MHAVDLLVQSGKLTKKFLVGRIVFLGSFQAEDSRLRHIGGLGSLPGTVVAAILIGLSDGIISVFFSPTLAKILATLLVALVLVFRPQGLFGVRRA